MFPIFSLILPVADLERSVGFYCALGYPISQRCAGERAICVAISKSVHAMLHSRDRFTTLTAREIVDPDRGVEAIFALEVATRADVDELVDRALAAGGRPAGGGIERERCYSRGFLDPDGHQFAVICVHATAAEMSSFERAVLLASNSTSRRTE
jgi:predicted lactoylglutathione lyase